MRCADDGKVFVPSRCAGERVMELLRSRCTRLHLTVNETKSAVASEFWVQVSRLHYGCPLCRPVRGKRLAVKHTSVGGRIQRTVRATVCRISHRSNTRAT